MLYRVLDLRFSKRLGGIDDEPLQRLLHGHEVVSRTERLYHHDGEPHLLVSLLYRLATLPAAPRNGKTSAAKASEPPARRSREQKDEEWKSILEEDDTKLFETLRAWRTRRARADAVPPYVVLTNVQLARVANTRPQSLSELSGVEGLGRSRIERFGKEILEVVASGVVPGDEAMDPAEESADLLEQRAEPQEGKP